MHSSFWLPDSRRTHTPCDWAPAPHQDERIEGLLRTPGSGAAPALAAAARLKARGLRASLARPDRARLGVGASGTGATPELPSDTALVEYHVGLDTTWRFVRNRGRVVAEDLRLPGARLARDVERLLAPLRQAAAAADGACWLDLFDPGRARALARRLLGPGIAGLGAGVRRLLIVPDGPLHRLPFEMLPSAPAARDALATEYLSDRYDLSYALSSVLLGTTGRRRARSGSLLCAYSAPRPASLAPELGGARLRPLPGTRGEVARLAPLLPRVEVLQGRHATADAFCRAAEQASLIHVAGHAIADASGRCPSGVLLAPADGGRGYDLLPASSIAALRLRARLVTLSACDTAGGRLSDREGPLGLTRAFLAAGAGAVAATLWPIEDRFATVLMTTFYRRLAQGEEPAGALAGARRAIRGAGSRWAHPFFWAPFVLFDHQALPGEAAGSARVPLRLHRP